jgi:hypothetical protein
VGNQPATLAPRARLTLRITSVRAVAQPLPVPAYQHRVSSANFVLEIKQPVVSLGALSSTRASVVLRSTRGELEECGPVSLYILAACTFIFPRTIVPECIV